MAAIDDEQNDLDAAEGLADLNRIALQDLPINREDEEMQMNEAKNALGMLYNTKKPEHAGDGLTSGLGNMAKGLLAGGAAIGAMTAVGAKEGGISGGIKGFGVGLLAGGGLAIGGLGTGVY